MSWLERYLRQPHLITSLLLLGVVWGVLSFKRMPLNLFPEANYPQIAVILVWPGASAADMADKVARPVEKELAALDLVRKVRSVSRDEVSAVSVEFDYRKGLDSAQVEVSAALDRIWASLPSGLLPPRLFRISDATAPVCTLAVYPRPGSHLDLPRVRQIADNELREALLRIPEVAQVEVFGGYKPEIRVEISRDRLARYGLSLETVLAAIYGQNRNIPGGVIYRQRDQLLIQIEGEVRSPEELGDLVIARKGKAEIHLRDIAELRFTYAERQSFFHGNGRPAIGINILRPEKGHVTYTLKALHQALPKIKKQFPELEIEIVDTQEDLIQTSISNLIGALRDAILLTVAVIFIFLARLRLTLLVALAIPFTYFITFGGMRLLGLELNIVTMTAIIIAVGLLVDDAIVVTENIDRHLRKGLPPKEAALVGTQEIWRADFAGTFTTIAVLVPIMFVGGYVGKILRPLALVLAVALLTSYVISITLIPLLAPKILRGNRPPHKWEKFLSRLVETALEPLRAFMTGLFLRAERRRFLALILAVAALVISLRQMPLVGRDLMPPMDTGILKIAFETEAGTPLEKTENLVQQMESLIQSFPGYLRMATVVGSEPGVVSFGSERTPQQGLLTVHFVDRFHREDSIWDLGDRLREAFNRLPGLKYVHVYEFGATPLSSIAAPVEVRISGPDIEILDTLARDVQERLFQVRGLTSISRSWEKDKREIRILFHREKLARFGLTPPEVASFVRAAFSGAQASVLRVEGEDGHAIVVRFPEKERTSIEDLRTLLIPSPKGPVPLNEIASFQEKLSPTVFIRENLSPVVEVRAYRRKAAITHLQDQVQQVLKGLEIPPGYRLSQEGEVKPMQEAFARLKGALLISLILLYFSLVPTFRSFGHPLTIMVAIPLALIGAVWGLLLVGRHFCMPAAMGLILLSGIVVNNAIILLDFIEKARAQGVGRREAIVRAIRIRTRPILMTAASTITGMLPIAAERALGLERLSPLAVVAIGGLLISTLLTLFYVPLFYTILDDLRARWRGRN